MIRSITRISCASSAQLCVIGGAPKPTIYPVCTDTEAVGYCVEDHAMTAPLRSHQSLPARSVSGFSLVELLVGMAISIVVIGVVSSYANRLKQQAALSGDYSELAERAQFAANQLGAKIMWSWQRQGSLVTGDLCTPLESSEQRGVSVVAANTVTCPSLTAALPVEVLRLEWLSMCDSQCLSDAETQSWLVSTDCHPVSLPPLTEPYVLGNSVFPTDCSEQQVARLHRSLFYLRDYAWQVGDDLGALMQKRWDAATGRYKQAEMLVPGVRDWRVLITGEQLELSMLLRGWQAGHRAQSRSSSWGSAAFEHLDSAVLRTEPVLRLWPGSNVPASFRSGG